MNALRYCENAGRTGHDYVVNCLGRSVHLQQEITYVTVRTNVVDGYSRKD
jgi:hypothetical protein